MKNLNFVSFTLLIALQGYSQTYMSQVKTLNGSQNSSEPTSSTETKTGNLRFHKSNKLLKVEDAVKAQSNKVQNQFNFPNQKPFSQGKLSGGGDAGGGGTKLSPPADLINIKRELVFLRSASTTLIERFFSINTEFTYPLIQLLGPSGLVMRALDTNEKVQLVFSHKKCPGQIPGNDAVANRQENSICISIETLLAKKHPKSVIGVKIAALYLHELSHILGLGSESSSEDIAEKFQTGVEESLPEGYSSGRILSLRNLAVNEFMNHRIHLSYYGDMSDLCLRFVLQASQVNINSYIAPIEDYYTNSEYASPDSVLTLSQRTRFMLYKAYKILGLAACVDSSQDKGDYNTDIYQAHKAYVAFADKNQMSAVNFLSTVDEWRLDNYKSQKELQTILSAPIFGNADQLRSIADKMNQLISETVAELHKASIQESPINQKFID